MAPESGIPERVARSVASDNAAAGRSTNPSETTEILKKSIETQ